MSQSRDVLKQRLLQEARQRRQQRPEGDTAPRPAATSVDERFTRFDRHPGYQQLKMMREGGKRLGIPDPFFKVHESTAGATTVIGGRECINFASYNYLGLAHHPKVIQAGIDALNRYGSSVSASRPVSGERPIHHELERAIAETYEVEDAVAFVSGHATNVSTLGYLLGPKDLILHDEYIHNSTVVGAQLSGARRMSFAHNDPAALETLLTRHRRQFERVVVVIEGLYSMDGDAPDLKRFVEIKQRHQAWLMVERQELNDEVEVIAHRGSSEVAPENSLSAIRQALEDGADQVEIDVRLSADGSVVLSHDATLQRLAGDPRRVTELNWQELATLDVGSGFSHAFAGERLARLDQALAAVRGRADLIIELKPSRGQEQALIEAVVAELDAERRWRLQCRDQADDRLARMICGDPRLFETTWMASLSYRQIHLIEAQEPRARTLLLAEWALPGSLPQRRFDGLGLRNSQIDDDQLRRAHLNQTPIYAWTVNDPGRMARLIDMGVDGIITDRPERLSALLRERRSMSDAELLLTKLRHWLADD